MKNTVIDNGLNEIDRAIKKLLAAVLDQAISDYIEPKLMYGVPKGQVQEKHNRNARERLRNDAKRWIFEDENYDVFTFNHICGELGINPEAERKIIRILSLLSPRERRKAIRVP